MQLRVAQLLMSQATNLLDQRHLYSLAISRYCQAVTVNTPDCCTSLFSSQRTLALILSAESSPIMFPMQYNNYVTLNHIWAHMGCDY